MSHSLMILLKTVSRLSASAKDAKCIPAPKILRWPKRFIIIFYEVYE